MRCVVTLLVCVDRAAQNEDIEDGHSQMEMIDPLSSPRAYSHSSHRQNDDDRSLLLATHLQR
jgi:hypothetical protein